MINFPEINDEADEDIEHILRKIRYKGEQTNRAIRSFFRFWSINHLGKLSLIQGRNANGYGLFDFCSREYIPYSRIDGLDSRPAKIGKISKGEIAKTVDPNHNAAHTENPTIITHTNMTSYIRAVNDYTISVHELYVKAFENTPHVSSIVSIKDAPFSEIEAMRTDIDGFFIANKFEVIKDGDIGYYDDEEIDNYSVYRQNVALYKDENRHFGVELLGTSKLISVTIIGNDPLINAKLTEHLIATKSKYKTIQEARKDKTFYTISSSQRGFELEDLNIKAEHLDEIILDNYNDDFSEAHEVVMKSIDTDKKGLILLHGIPGSGKTSYIKHLITGDSKRKIVYIPTHLTSAISSPNFISFVKSELSNSVLVIEDAEQVLLSRENAESYKEAVSNILNMTDGILADALNILIICTFNTDMSNIDKALLRKGRLLLQYKFDDLNKEKTDALCQKLYGRSVGKSLPLSDIYGLDYELITPKQKPTVKFGFA